MIGKSFVALASFLFFALRFLPASQQLYIVQRPAEYDGDKLDIAIYYESLCPDSRRFVTQQLPGAYTSFKQHINIKFVPFGKAMSTVNPDETIEFQCQHGPRECDANMMQSCALQHISDPDKQAQFVPCVMAGSDPSDLGPKCAAEIGLDFNDVETCMATDQGVDLQIQAEVDTNNVQNPLDFVPTIVYNKAFDEELSFESLRDFSSVICSQLPNICGK